MALSVVKMSGVEAERVKGPWREKLYTCTMDTSYPTGGYAVTNKTFGLNNLYGLIFVGGQCSGGYVLEYVLSTTLAGNILAYATGTASGDALNQVTSGTNLSTVTFNVIALGQ